MSKTLPGFSLDLTIPGFDVRVANARVCHAKSKDGSHEFSAEIEGPFMRIYGSTLPKPLSAWIAEWKRSGHTFTSNVNDLITHVANSLRLADELAKDGFPAKINENTLVVSHPSKPSYSLRMYLTDARKFAASPPTSVYTAIEYCGPAYDEKSNTKWKGNQVNNHRLVPIDKDFDEFCQELKTRVLSLGEPDPRIEQWVSQELEAHLLPQGFIFTPKPEKGIVELSHPAGLSGDLSFAPFTAGVDYHINPKYPNPHFPNDIEKLKVVLFTCKHPNIQDPYTQAWLETKPHEAIHTIQGLLALALVYQEICKDWKSDILVPKLSFDRLQLVNTKLKGQNSIALTLTPKNTKLLLKVRRKKYSYPVSSYPPIVETNKITQEIISRAEQHVQEFIRANGLTTKIIEIDF
jgi:hypothetical protein